MLSPPSLLGSHDPRPLPCLPRPGQCGLLVDPGSPPSLLGPGFGAHLWVGSPQSACLTRGSQRSRCPVGGAPRNGRQFLFRWARGRGCEQGHCGSSFETGVLREGRALRAGRPPPAWLSKQCPASRLRSAWLGVGKAPLRASVSLSVKGVCGSTFLAQQQVPSSSLPGLTPASPPSAQLAHEPRQQQRGHQAPAGPQRRPQSPGPSLREHGVLHQAHLCYLRGPLLR